LVSLRAIRTGVEHPTTATTDRGDPVKCGARVALGVIGGYFLGRTKKMKLAMMLGGMAAGRKAGGPGELLRTGTKLLNSSPELARLTDEVRGRLLEAGKGAALAVAARQVESLTDRVGKRVESLGDVGVPRRKKSEEPEDEYEDAERADVDDEDAERADVDDEGPPPAEDEDEEEALPPRRAQQRARSGKAASSRGGKNGAGATATLKRTAGPASGAARTAGKAAAGRKSGRTTRTPRSDGDG
jgi:hypothetical protein